MSRFACQTLVTRSVGASTISAASTTESGFGTLFGNFGARSTANAGLDAKPRRSRNRTKVRTTDRPRAIDARSTSAARCAKKAR